MPAPELNIVGERMEIHQDGHHVTVFGCRTIQDCDRVFTTLLLGDQPIPLGTAMVVGSAVGLPLMMLEVHYPYRRHADNDHSGVFLRLSPSPRSPAASPHDGSRVVQLASRQHG